MKDAAVMRLIRRRKTETITVTHEFLRIRGPHEAWTAWCGQCGRDSRLIPPEDAAILTGVDSCDVYCLLRESQKEHQKTMNRITRKKFSIVLFLIVLTIAVFWLARSSSQPASARIADGSVKLVSHSVFGMTPGEAARVCIGTTNPRGQVLDWLVRFSDGEGTLLFQLPEQRSPLGEWRCSAIAQSMLPVVGDAGTGRVQVAMEVIVKAPAGTKSSEIVGAAEIITAAGQTETHFQLWFRDDLLISPVMVGGSATP